MSKKEMTLTPAWEVRTTLPSEEAAVKMATELVKSRFAACVQISGPVRSVYRWNNAIQSELEWSLTIKTLEELLPNCMDRITQLHSYDVPEIISNPIQRLSDSYHRWLQNELVQICNPPTSTPQSDSLKPWHLQIQTMGSTAVKIGKLELPSMSGCLLCDQWSQPSGPSPLKVQFESIAEAVSPWPGMHFEMDGSFVWVSSDRDQANQPRWQLDGMVYDRNDEVQYVELKGVCDRRAWVQLVSVLSPSSSAPLAVHLVKHSAWILESDFREMLS